MALSKRHVPTRGLVVQGVQHQTDRFLDVLQSFSAVVSLADASGQSWAVRGEAPILFLLQNNRECSSLSSHLRSTPADSSLEFGEQKAPEQIRGPSSVSIFGSGGWIRTNDLRVMSPTSCHCSTPRRGRREQEAGVANKFEALSMGQVSRPVSTGMLKMLPSLHTRPIKQIVSLQSYSLARPGKGGLILGDASRLDAFSAYHFQTWLPSAAPGGTTGTP